MIKHDNNSIEIINAYENNLKNINLLLPLNKIITVIGISGSGKTSLIYNVLSNEAERREKIDSGKATCYEYAIRPKFDEIKNLPYSVTLKQRGLHKMISSTIATISQVHKLLRKEFFKNGNIVGEKGNLINKPTAEDIKFFIEKYYHHEKFDFYAIVCYEKNTDGKKEIQLLLNNGISEAVFISTYDNKRKISQLKGLKSLNNKYNHTILVQFKNLDEINNYINIAQESFLFENKNRTFNFMLDYPDLHSGKIYQKKSEDLFSFNSNSKTSGRCYKCSGTGLIEAIDINSLFNNNLLSAIFINIPLNSQGRYENIILYPDSIKKLLIKESIDLNLTYYDLNLQDRQIINDIIFPKIFTHRNKPSIGKFINTLVCPECKGNRLNYKATAVKFHGFSITELLKFTVNELIEFLEDKKLENNNILIILKSLKKSTLGYLSLERTTNTLSEGELQRLKFAIELNNEYKNLVYILDEPSKGLHSYNNYQMINLIKDLRNKGNTIILSEHNLNYINNSDYIVKLGPQSGDKGGEIIYSGDNYKIEIITIPRTKMKVDIKNAILLNNVNINNIKNEFFLIPLNCLVTISGLSGSGKSSLIYKVLVPSIKQYIADKTYNTNIVKEIKGIENIKDIIELNQSQIGNNSRSIVGTYLDIFGIIRKIYANLDVSSYYNFVEGHFSFSSVGACDTCKGLGEIDDKMCTSCLGERFKPEVLEVKFKNLTIYDFLNKEISYLYEIIDDIKLKFAFNILKRLGLSHLTLGRITATLSGGEAQRLKLAEVLIKSYNKIEKGNILFVLDEPTSGLSSMDIDKIYNIINEILSFNNSVIIIEHNIDIIKNSDYIIDIGIGSGKDGGKNIFSGSFEELLKNKVSITAKAFRNEFDNIIENNECIDQTKLIEKIYTTKSNINCNKFYLSDKHFKIEKEFYLKYNVVTDENNHYFFRTKEELFDFTNHLIQPEIYFNPFTSELYKYKIVPETIKKDKINQLKKYKFDFKQECSNEWEFRVKVNDFEKAYNYGNGWITVKSLGKTYELFTRLISIKNKIIGSPKINEHIFNLYTNSCIYCNGKFEKEAYDSNLIILDKEKSILDKGFFNSNININLKSIIAKFKKEKLFDFSKPYNKLNNEEKNIFLYGFREYKFLKHGGNPNIESDYIEWRGIYSYIFRNLDKIKIAREIKDSRHKEICPFCINGFNKEVNYYLLDKKSIIDFLTS